MGLFKKKDGSKSLFGKIVGGVGKAASGIIKAAGAVAGVVVPGAGKLVGNIANKIGGIVQKIGDKTGGAIHPDTLEKLTAIQNTADPNEIQQHLDDIHDSDPVASAALVSEGLFGSKKKKEKQIEEAKAHMTLTEYVQASWHAKGWVYWGAVAVLPGAIAIGAISYFLTRKKGHRGYRR